MGGVIEMCKYDIPKQYAYTDQNATPGKEFKRFETPVNSDAHLKAVRGMLPHTDEYVSVYGWKDWIGGRITPEISQTAIVDAVFLDFDDKNDPEKALRDAAEVAQYVGHSTCNFSGSKGAHVMIKCYIVDLIPELKGHVIRQFVNNLVDELPELDTLDYAVVGDTSRVHRIVDSVHSKTKLHAIGLTAEELSTLTIDEVHLMAENRRGLIQVPEPSQWVTDELMRIEGEILQTRLTKLHDKEQIGDQMYHFASAILQSQYADRAEIYSDIDAIESEWRAIRAKQNINLRGTIIGSTREETWLIHAVRDFRATGRAASGSRKAEHKERVHLAKSANDCGWTFSEICDIYTGADDYDPAITERMVKSCIGRR